MIQFQFSDWFYQKAEKVRTCGTLTFGKCNAVLHLVILNCLCLSAYISQPRCLFSCPALQVPCLPHLQKHLGRSGFLCHRGNTGHQVQVSLQHNRNLSSAQKQDTIYLNRPKPKHNLSYSSPKPKLQFIYLALERVCGTDKWLKKSNKPYRL